MGTLRDMRARRRAGKAAGGVWLTESPKAVASYNRLHHSALQDTAPGEVKDDTDLRFQLRYENVGGMRGNAAKPKERKRKLDPTGAFRTLLHPTAFKRRANMPNGPTEVHTAANVTAARITDSQGNLF